jgi:rifampicin phosphotransferase
LNYLVRFEDDIALDPSVVGHKFASLARATRSGFDVPSAVAIRVEAHDDYRRNKDWPEGLQGEIRDAAKKMILSRGVSVRSSSTLEDLEGKSFAGQYDTYLDIRDEDDLKDKVEKCWESAASHLVFDYLDDPSIRDEEAPRMSVMIQKMVHAKAAGVAFSRNPMYPLRNEVVAEGVPGLGEKLVSGHVTPYRVFVRNNRILKDETTFKTSSSGHVILENLNWREIAQLAGKAEANAGGKPQDIEWAIDGNDKLWLLQSRPITTIRDVDLKAPPGTWTRKIAEDLWADRLTPFLADAMTKNTPRFDLSRNAEFLRIPVIRPSLSVINGFLYVNCEGLKKVLTLIPQKFRINELRALFPPGFEIDSIMSPSVTKLFGLAVRALCLGVVQPQGNPLFCRHLSRINLKKLQNHLNRIESLPHLTAAQALRKTDESLECLALLQEKNQWPYLYATLFTWALRWVVKDMGGLAYSDFLHLLSANTDNITTEIEREMRQLSETLRNDKMFLDSFLNQPPEKVVGTLPPPLQEKFDIFLQKYGCRSRHRTLYLKRWKEAPEEVLGMMATLLRSPMKGGLANTTNPSDPVTIIRQKLSWCLRLLLRPLLKFTCDFLNLREDLRFFLDKILYRIRQSVMTLGKHSGLGEDVLFLTQSELEQVVERKMDFDAAKGLARNRRDAFLEQSDVYTFYIDGRPMDELPSNAKIIHGTGTSPGRATGRARIVEDPTQHNIQKGDILVAKNTDPGWTPILRIVSGIVVEEGGILNHCSIVARELGIPAVVGVRQATKKIPENTSITIDGGFGAVQMAETA